MARLASALAFFDPALEILTFPAWDCLPYDRASPNTEIVSRRVDTLTRLADTRDGPEDGKRIVLTTVNALVQRVPPRPCLPRPRAAPRDRRPDRARPAGIVPGAERLCPDRYGARGRRVRCARRHRRPLPVGGGESAAARFLRRHARRRAQLRPLDPALDRQARAPGAPADERGAARRPGGAALPHTLSRAVRHRRRRRSALRIRSAPAAAISAWSIGCRSTTKSSRRCSTICLIPPCCSITRRSTCATCAWRRSTISTPHGRT